MKLIKYSVTYAAKSFVYQCLAHGKGHFTKRLEKAVQDHGKHPTKDILTIFYKLGLVVTKLVKVV